jgi:N-acetylneuraminic acid mutarotase
LDASGRKNDLWAYDPAANNWALLTPSGTPPSARSYHSMVWDGVNSRVIMFGGYDGAYKNDLWAYDPAANNWALLTPSGTPPSARYAHSMVWDGQRVIMFGGYDGAYKNDLWWWW